MAAKPQMTRIATGVATMVLLLGVAGAAAPAADAGAHHARAATHGHRVSHRHHHHRHAASSAAAAASPSTDASGSAATVTPAPAAPSTAPGAPVAATGACADGDLLPSPANLDRVRAATLCLVNQQRTGQGLAPLRESAGLDGAAQRHSADMVAGNYFAHVSPTGLGVLDRVVATGYGVVGGVLDVGENIATADGSLSSAGATVAGWMKSPEHRANILNPAYRDTGMGVAAGAPALLGSGGQGATYTECFAAAG